MPTIKQLSRIFSADDSLNRLQDQLASALNPILRNVQGDLSGPLESPNVVGLQGRSLSAVAPTTGQSIVWTGTQWAPGSGGGLISSVLPPLVVTSNVLSIPQANATTDGYLDSADWVTFNNKVGSVTASSPLASSGGSTPNISLTGVVAAANGGTGLSSPGTAGNVLTSTGTGWTSAAATASPIGPAGGVLGYTGSTYPNPNGLAALPSVVPSEEIIPILRSSQPLIRIVPDSVPPLAPLFTPGQGIELAAGFTSANGGVGGSITIRAGSTNSNAGGTATFIGGVGGGFFPYYRGGNTIVIGGPGAFNASTPSSKGGDTLVSGGEGGRNVFLATVGYGGDLALSGGSGSTQANGGKIYIGARQHNGINTTSEIQIGTATQPPLVEVRGSNVNVYGGAGTGTAGAGGNVTITAGDGTSSANGGTTTIQGGYAGPTGTGGDAYVKGGSGPSGRDGGDVYIIGGQNTSTNATGGDVTIRGGDGTTDGNVRIGETTTAAVFVAASAIKTHVQGPVVWTPPATQTISAATDSFTPNRTFIKFNITGGNHTLTSTPTIATTGAVEGQMVILMNVDSADHINLQRGATYALSLSNSTHKIDPGGSMVLVFDGTYWVEIAHTVATSI